MATQLNGLLGAVLAGKAHLVSELGAYDAFVQHLLGSFRQCGYGVPWREHLEALRWAE
jgi:hypothetical protein